MLLQCIFDCSAATPEDNLQITESSTIVVQKICLYDLPFSQKIKYKNFMSLPKNPKEEDPENLVSS